MNRNACPLFQPPFPAFLLALLAVLLLLPQPSAAEIRTSLTIHNNTDATLTIFLMLPYEKNAIYGEYIVPPVSARTFSAALRLGYTRMIAEARRCSGTPRVDRTFYYGSSTQGAVIELFPKDFGLSVMFDGNSAPGGQEPAALDGLWERSDGHRVTFISTGNGRYIGQIETLGSACERAGFMVGETTFQLLMESPARYTGRIKWRSSDGREWWENVVLTLNGRTMNGAGVWEKLR